MTSGFIQRIRSPPCVSSGAVRSSQRRIRLALIGAAHATAATAYRIMHFTLIDANGIENWPRLSKIEVGRRLAQMIERSLND